MNLIPGNPIYLHSRKCGNLVRQNGIALLHPLFLNGMAAIYFLRVDNFNSAVERKLSKLFLQKDLANSPAANPMKYFSTFPNNFKTYTSKHCYLYGTTIEENGLHIMIEIGKYNELRVLSKTEAGLNLTDGDKLVILPYQYVPRGLEIGDNVNVFVYIQKDGRLTGTTQKAYAEVGDFAFLKVVSDGEDGTYIDLGIDKDVYVPTKEQKRPMQKGYKYVVYLYLDENNERLLASSKLYDFVEEEDFDFEEGDEVSLLITEETDLGFNAIINNTYIGLLYHNEVFDNIQVGEQRKGWIKKIRVEGKIDLTLQPSGYGHILDSKEMILAELKKSGGIIELGDKSSPEEIYHRFQISKSAFKKTIGSLYKERLIVLSDDSIRLLTDDDAE